jgi:glutamine synthetase
VPAIDTLLSARQTIAQIAHTYGLRATYHPQPLPGTGTAAHAHISLSCTPSTPEWLEVTFFGSILNRLTALCAFTLPESVSYLRVVDDSWTGGTWVAWGTQNRETPLRRVETGRWELRCLDGMANTYLALAAVLGAGLLGLRRGVPVRMRDCTGNPSKLDDRQRRELGIVERMPRDLETALGALREDAELRDVLGAALVRAYVEMKEVEQEMLERMPEADRHVWLIERY